MVVKWFHSPFALISYNKPSLPPILLNDFGCLFLLGITVIPREIEDNAYEFFSGEGGRRGGRSGERQSRCIMGDWQWHILALFCPFKDLGILDQLILLVLLLNRRPASRSFLSLVQFWRTRERLCLNRVRPLLGICCMRCLLLEYIFDPRPDSRAPGTADPVMTFGYQ